MTPRERFLNSLLCRPVDRFFRHEHGPWPSTWERWLREGFPQGQSFNAEFGMDPVARFGIASGYTDSPYWPKFEERTLAETADQRTFVDGDGITKKVFRTHADTSMPQFLKFPVADRADWAAVRRRLNPADAAARCGAPERLKSFTADPGVPTMLPICGAFGHPRNLFGDEGLAYVQFDDPALLDEILENWCDLYLALLTELTRSARVDVLLIWEDMCYKNGPLISPAHFRRFMQPVYRRLIDHARACGVQAILVDTDGDCLSLIPHFLDAGTDAFMPFEVQAGMDVVAIRRQFGATFGIMGGIDKRVLADGHTRAEIEREVDRVLPFFLEHGGLIPTLDHTVPIDVPLSHFRWYLDCVRKYEAMASGACGHSTESV